MEMQHAQIQVECTLLHWAQIFFHEIRSKDFTNDTDVIPNVLQCSSVLVCCWKTSTTISLLFCLSNLRNPAFLDLTYSVQRKIVNEV